MFDRFRRRPTPATAIAGVALFVALSGTAVAQSDIFISSPDQLASNVVTNPKIAQNSIFGRHITNGVVSDNDLDDPQLKVRGMGSGGQLADSDGTSVRTSSGIYQVTFDTRSLNSNPTTPTTTTAAKRRVTSGPDEAGSSRGAGRRIRDSAGSPERLWLGRAGPPRPRRPRPHHHGHLTAAARTSGSSSPRVADPPSYAATEP